MMALGWIVALAGAQVSPAAGSQLVPTIYEAGHFYATPETTDGHRLRLMVDTGGGGGNLGLYWFDLRTAQPLHLATRTCSLPEEGATLTVADPPAYKPGRSLPPPLPGACGVSVLIQNASGTSDDGQLGASYFKGRVWTFDYPGQHLILESKDWKPGNDVRHTAMHFKQYSPESMGSYPRVTMVVDGQPVDMLLDTGATAHPTTTGKQASNTSTVNGFGVTSYIAKSVLERWHKAHPDWRIVQNGDDLNPKVKTRLIEVPAVDIAGWRVGPVWFTEQPDNAYHVYMAQWMDKPIDGALGGNVFAHFVMTLDYPSTTAYFRCVTGCKPFTPPPAP
jgi:hypothetical protein